MATKKITQYSELTTPSLADLLAAVSDPGGSPVTKKLTLANLKALLAPTVVAHYWTNAGQSFPDGVYTTVNFVTKVADSHNAVTTGAAWKFTAPAAGYYVVSTKVNLDASSAWALLKQGYLALHKNDVRLVNIDVTNNQSANTWAVLSGTTVIYLAAAEYIDMRLYHNAGATLTGYSSGGGEFTHISIWRLA
jgi:hypothetical protein